MKKIITLCVLMALVCVKGWGQPFFLGTDVGGTYNNYTASIPVSNALKQQRVQETVSTGSGTRKWEWNADSYFNTWRGGSANLVISGYNAVIPPNTSTASAVWRNNSGGFSSYLPATTASNYYTFNITYTGSSYRNENMSVLETNYNPVTVSSVSQIAGTYGSRTVTITTSATPSTGENIYVRYSTNNYSTSTLVQATGSGTTWTATIPWQSSAVSFYVYTGNRTISSINSDVASYGQSAHDMSTLNLNNNGGSNYAWTPASGPIVVTSTGGTAANTATSYSTFTTATTGLFAVLNGGTVHTGTVTVLVTADVTTEPGGNNAGTTGQLNNSVAWTSLGIQPNGARTISGAATAGAPLIDFAGADNVTIDGLSSNGNSLTISNTTASATSGTSTIRFIGGATNNTITNSTILGSFSAAVGTNGGNVFFSTDGNTTNGNDNNTISNNNIGPAGANLPTKGIYGNGSTTNLTIGNSGIVINNNNIYDCFGAGVASAGMYISSGNNAWSITNNRIYQTGTRTWTGSFQHSGIYVVGTVSTSGAQGFTITGNTIGYASNTQTGTYTLTGSGGSFFGIFFNGFSTGTATTISNNIIASVSLTGVSSSGTITGSPFTAILFAEGNGTTNNNTIGSQSATGSLIFSSSSTSATDIYGILNNSSTAWTSNNNLIGGITATNAATSSAFIVYGLRANTGSGVTWTATSNTIGGSIANSIQNNSASTAAQTVGLYSALAPSVFTSNTIRNMTAAGGTGTTTSASVIGIDMTSSSVNNTLSQNTIYSLSNSNTTAATVVTGIQFTGGSANTVERNFIYGLTSSTTSTSAEINGIRVGGGTTLYKNNMIAIGAGVANALGSAATVSSTAGINGINEFLGTDQFFHNSVYIGGSPTSGSGASFVFNGVQTVNTRSFRDNVFFNGRSNSGATGKNYAIKLNGTTANPSGLTINNNVYFTNGTGGVFGNFNSADVSDLTAWKTAVGQDANSYFANPQFISPAAVTPDLHINATVVTPVEGTGVDLGVTEDYDGQTRFGLTPVDIGADAGNFTSGDFTAPTITYTALTNTTSTSNITLSGVTIADAGGVPTTGTLVPRIYYRKGTGAWFSQAGTLTSGSGTSGTWNFTIVNSDMGGVAVGDVISYYVIAQDNTGNIASNPSSGLVATNVNTVTTAPTAPNTYTIIPAPLSGTYTVGAGQTYTTLTAAVNAYNVAGVSGAVTFSLTDASYAGETYPITINATTGASAANTLTIKPTQSATTFSGSSATALIVLNGADYVTIDGSTGSTVNTVCPVSAASRNLTFTNTSTSTTSAVIWLQTVGTTDGATNNTVKNCILTGSGNTQTLFGIGSGGSSISTTSLGAGNNNNSFVNNSTSKTQYGIYSQGASAANKNTGTIINQNLINTPSPNNVQYNGIWVGFEDGITISGNNVAGLSVTTGDIAAISLGITPTSFGYATTTGNDVTNATVSNNAIGSVTNTAANSAVGLLINSVASGTTSVINNTIYGPIIAPTTSSDLTAGIFLCGGTSTSTTNVYFNSVSMTGARGASSYNSFALAIGGSNPVVNVKNNILSNTQTSSSTGGSYAIGVGYTTYTNLSSNYNDLYTATTLTLGLTGALSTSGTSRTFATWQTTTSTDANSINSIPNFASPTNLVLVAGSPAIGVGITGTGITSDITCTTRSTTAPTLGAYETPVTVLTLNSVTTNLSAIQCTATPRTVTANITAGNSAISSVTLYYSYNGGTATSVNMALATGSASLGTSTWTGTIPAATPANATVTWYVTATDAYTTKTLNGTSYSDAPFVNNTATATSSKTSVCSGTDATTLTGAFTKVGNSSTIGSGTTTSGSTSAAFVAGQNFYGTYWGNARQEWLIKASELSAAGLSAGNITALSVSVGAVGSPTSLTGFTIKMGSTSATTLTTAFSSATLTTVYTSGSYAPAIGTNLHIFSTPFVWDGTSNIVIDVCNSNSVTGSTSATNTYSTPGFSCAVNYGADGSGGSGACTTTTVSNGSGTARPNFILTGNVPTTFSSYSWNYGATVIGSGNPLTYTPTTASTSPEVQSYTVTGTDATTSCSVTSSGVAVTVNPKYTITASANTGGTITPADATSICSGGSQAYTITATTGYTLTDVKVDGVSQGAITTYTFPAITAAHTISATFTINTYNIVATTPDGNGTITPAGTTSVNYDGSQNYTIAANATYHILDVKVDGISQGAIATYSFTHVIANHTISATFAINTYTLTYSTDGNGTISGTNPQTVNQGTNGTTVTAVPTTGYHFVQWSDGVPTASRTETNVTANVSVTALFAINTYTLTYTSGGNGTISGSSSQTVNYNTSGTTVTAVPATGYHFVNWSDNSAANPRTDNSVQSDITVTANFAIDQFTITVTAGANGTITPGTSTTINSGSTPTYAITPNANYSVQDVLVDGVSVGAVTTYTFTNVTANHTISATFYLTSCPNPANADAGPDGSVCGSATYTLAGTIGGGATTATWTTNGTGTFSPNATYTGSGNTTYTPSAADIAAGSVTLTLTTNDPNPGICGAATDNIILTVDAVPTVNISGNSSICAGGNATLTATATAGSGTITMYQWYNGATPVGTNSNTYTATAAGTYTVLVTNSNGCSTTSNAIAVSVNAVPSTSIDGNATQSFCAGNSLTLTSTNTAGSGTITGYQWNLNGSPITTNGTSSSYTVTAGGSYTLTVTNSNGCSTTSNAVVVSANAAPSVNITGANGFCAGGSTVLTANATTGSGTITTYQWNLGGSPISGATSSTYTASAAGSYTVTVANSNGCSTTSGTFAVSQNAAPTVTASSNCSTTYGGPITLTATATAGSGTISTYQWVLNGTTNVGPNSATYTTSTAGSYTVTVTNSNGCSTTSTTPVVINAGSGALTAGNYTIGGSGCNNFANIAAAISYLNANGVSNSGGNGSIIFSIAAFYTETAPSGGFVITGTGTAANPVVFTKASGTVTITASGSQPLGSTNDAVFKIVGADYITLDGFIIQENAANSGITVATNTVTEFGIALYAASTTNGAKNNTIQNNIISLNGSYAQSFGILSTTTWNSATTTLGAYPTAQASVAGGENSNNKIYGNQISTVAFGILVVSPVATATFSETGNDIGGTSVATGNTISAYGNNIALPTGYQNVQSFPGGITVRNNVGVNVQYNTVTSISNLTITTTGITISAGTTPAGVTYTNTISNNNVTVTNTGTTPATGIDFGYGITTGTIAGSNNTITLNQLSTAANSGALIGINAAYASATNTLNGNNVTVNQSNSTGATTSAVTGITAAGAGTTVNVTNNTVTIKQAVSGAGTFGSGTITYLNTSAASGTINVTGNTLNTTGSTIRSIGTLYGVFQDATVTSLVNVKGNTANIDRVAASGTAYFQYTSGTPSEVADTVSNNNITFTNLAGTSVVTAINSGGGPTTPGVNNKSISNNTISISGTNTGTSIGITASFANTGKFTGNTITISTASPAVTGLTTSSTIATVSGNVLSLASSTLSPTAMTGISISGSGAHSITANTFTGLSFTGVVTASPTITGIACSANGSTTTTANIFGNTITNISVGAAGSTASPTIDGILISGGTSVNVYKNKIYGLTTAATGATTVVNGIRLSGGSANNVYNNLIGNLTAPAAVSADAIRGISITSTTATSTHKVYYNTIYLNASSTGATFGTSGIYHVTSPTATTSVLDLRNNIVINLSTPGSTAGFTTAFRRSTATLTNYASTSNNNMFYAGTPGTNRLILYDGTNSYQNFSGAGSFQAAVSPRETASFTGETGFTYSTPGSFFISLTGSSADFLHLVAGITTQAESGAQAITSPAIADDYDGQTRPGGGGTGVGGTTANGGGTTPDIGADEFDGVPSDKIGPAITYTALGSNCGGGARTLTATIMDVSGVPTSGAGLPVAYWKVSTATTYTSVQGTSTGSNQYQFTIGTGSVAGDVIQYYIAAQDNLANVSVSPAAGTGTLTANPPAAATPPTTPSTYTNLSSLSGIYSVGSTNISGEAGHYATLTAAVTAYNASCVSGSVQFVLTDATYSTAETFPLVLNANPAASSTNTLTIKPNTGVTATITGSTTAAAVIKLNGADYVTIDGLNSGGTSLTINSTNTSTSSAVIWIASTSAADGATNNTVKNLILNGNGSYTTLGDIVSSGSTIGAVAEAANASNTYQNNTLTTAQYGINFAGPTTLVSGTVITGNTIGSTTIANKIGFRAIAVSNQQTVSITNNTIAGVVSTSSNTAAGIYVSGLMTAGSILNNKISDIKNTSASDYAAHGISLNSSSTATGLTVANNFVYDVTGLGYASLVTDNGFGIVIGTGGGYNIYFNSVSMNTTQTNAGYSAALYVASGTTANVVDNIFSNTQTTGTRYTVYDAGTSSTFTTINYNDYYVASGGSIGYLSSARSTLADWKTATGQDANSVSVDPVFTSATDLHLQTTSSLESKGTPAGGITTDIDGQTRNATTPDIGADEYDAVLCAAGTGTNQGGTATYSGSAICNSGSATITASGYAAGINVTYQWQYSNDNFATDINDLTGQTTSGSATATVSSTTYFRLKEVCSSSSTTYYSTVATVTVNNPVIVTTTPGVRCGVGTVQLAATGSAGTTLNWYATSTGGTAIGTGSPFTTPSISATTNFYVSASNGGASGSVGAVSPSVGTFSTSFTGSYEIFDVVGSSSTINSVDVYATAAGTVVVQLLNSSGTVLQTAATYIVTAAQANSTTTTAGTTITIPVNFVVPAGTGYRLNFGSASTATLLRNSTGAAAMYGPVAGVTITGNSFGTAGYYYNFYNWLVSNGCESARTLVTATVNTAPTFTVSNASAFSVCNGSTTQFNVTSNVSDFDTYTWTVTGGSLYLDAGATTPYTTGSSATTVYFVSSTAGTATITANASNTSTTCTAIDTKSVTVLPATVTASAVSTTICSSGSTTLNLSPSITASYANGTIQWQNSTTGTSGPWTDIAGANATTYTTPTITSTTYYQAVIKNSAGSSCVTSNAVTLTVNNPLITGTTPGTRCGTGTVTLSATGSAGTTLNWYTASTGGTAVGTGSPFTTPVLTATTTYYVGASTGTSTGSLGPVNPSIGAFSTSFTGSYEIFDVTGSSSTINGVDVFATTAGTVVIELRNSSGTVVQTAATYTVTAAQANSTSTTVGTPITIPVNFTIPAGTGYRLNLGSASTATLIRNSGGATATYGPVSGITITGNSFGTAGYYYNFYNWSVSNGCESARTPVTATVNTAPTVSINASQTVLCSTSLSPVTLTASSSNDPNYTYSWPAPINATGATQTVNPTSTTTYTVNALDNSTTCTATASVTIMVNTPPTVTVSPSYSSICAGGSAVKLSASVNGGSAGSLLNETFESGLGSFTLSNGNLHTAGTASQWTVRSSSYTSAGILGYTYSSGSKFALADADAAGSGFRTQTYLTSSSVNTNGYSALTLAFRHHYNDFNNSTTFDDLAKVEVSTDGGITWTAVQTYSSDVGSATSFASASLDLTAYTNQANLKIRFNYTADYDIAWAIDDVTLTGTANSGYTWSPVAGLFTDAAATTVYTGDSRAFVYAKPTSNTTYTAAETSSSCGSTSTATVTVGGLSGIYSIGSTNISGQAGHFATLTQAIGAYNNSCLSGAVTFALTDASYGSGETFPITINSSSTASSTNTLTIKPNAGVTATISGNNATALFKFNGADYVSVDGSNNGTATRNLTITNTNTASTGAVIWLNSTSATDGATNNTVKNTIITGTTSTSLDCGIISSGSTYGGVAEVANANNAYQNDSLSTMYTGIAVVGPSGNETGTLITNNVIGSTVVANKMGASGIELYQQAGAVVSGNIITGITASSSSILSTSGIAVYGTASGINIFNNKIRDIKHTSTGGYGANGILLYSTSTANSVTMYNNFISDIAGYGFSGTAYDDNGFGIVAVQGGGYNIYDNTIYMATNQTATTGFSAAVNITNGVTTAASVNIVGNILSDVQTVGSVYSIYSGAANTVYGTIDYNDYFTDSTKSLGYVGSTTRTDLAAMQAGFGGNTHSVSVEPLFVSATDLHLTSCNSGLDGKGTPISGITTDIDGETRNASTPDIGADEFTSVIAAAAISVTPTLPVCAGTSVTLTETGGTATSWLWSTNATTQSIIVTPTVTTTYTVIATTGSCNLPKSIIVTVNPLPTAAIVLPANPAICAGTIQPLTASAAESATLFSQNFNTTTAGTIPTGWTSSTVSTSSSWSAVTTTNAGGAANEMRFNAVSAPSGETGTYYLKSPVIDATGYTSLSMAFNFMLDNFSATTHPYTLRLQTSTDNNTWTDRWSVTPTGSTDISANTVTVNLGALDNSSTMYFRFAVVGEAYGLFYWYIDNAVISGIHSSTNIVWSPTTGLYTDAAATTPYAGGQATTVYAKPTATTIYTVTSSNGTCTNSTAKDTITVNPAPTAAFGSPTYEVCYGTAANISVTGTAGAVVHYHIGSSPTDYTDTLNASGSGTITTSSSAGSSTSNTTITYTLVSVTNLTSGCSQSLSGSTTLTIYALPAVADITGPDYIAFGKTGSYSNTTTGGTWSISDPNGTGSTLSNPSANPTTVTAGTTAGTFTLSYTVTGAGGCTTTVTKTIQTFDNVITRYRTKQDGYATDPDTWSILNDNNVWVDANAYPGNNDNIEVRHNLSLLYADYDGTSNGIFKITDYDTVIGGVTRNVQGTVTIAATHFFQSQGSVDFNGRRVTLKSSTTGTAAIGVMTTPILNATNVQVERFTDGKPSTNSTGSRRAWRLITSPVGGQTIHEAWQENAASNINPNPGYGTLITGIGFADSMAAAQQGYDWTGAVVTSSIKHYIAASNSWLPLSSDGSTTGTHVSVRNEPAYMLFVRGDRSVGAYGTTADTLRSTGTLQQSNQSLTFTAGNKFILAGNPYASTINFGQFMMHNSTLIQDKFYSWNSTIGTYGAYILVTHTGTGANNGGYEATPDEMTGLPEQNKDKYKYIPNGSGFFVLPLTSSTSGTLGFQETDKAPGLVPPVNPFKVVSTPTNVRQLLVNLNLKDSVATLADGFRARFSPDYEGNEEDNSTAKIYNFNENLNVVYGGKAHIIEARGEVKKTDTLYMKMWYVTKRQYQLQLRGDNFATAPGIQAWLVDNYLGTKQELALGGSVTSIDFGVNSDSLSAKSDRFLIVFENNSSVLPVTITKVKAAPSNGGVDVSWTVANEVNTKGYTIEKSTDGGRTFTDMGTQQPAHNNPQAAVTSYSGFDATPKTGDNFYRIRIEGKDGSLSYSEVVKVTTGASGAGIQITLYPNPVREGKANLSLGNLTAGTYLVSVYTGSGQTVYQKKIYITLGGTTQTEQLILGSNIAQGSYQIKVSDNKGNILFNDQLIVGR